MKQKATVKNKSMPASKKFTEEEKQFILANYPEKSVSEIANLQKRYYSAVYKFLEREGLLLAIERKKTERKGVDGMFNINEEKCWM